MAWWDDLKKLMPDYSGVGEAMPEHIGRERIMDPIVGAGTSLATLPQRAMGASADAVGTGTYNPGPAIETVLSTMGVGPLAGVSAGGKEAVLGAGLIRKNPLTGGYHGTNSPIDYSSFARSPIDIGTHFATNPNIATAYAAGKINPETFSGAGPRVIPVVGDINKAAHFPTNPPNWKDPEQVLRQLEIAKGKSSIPVSDIKRAAAAPGDWENNFFNLYRDRGYDALKYPHYDTKVDSYMAFNPEQVIPRFSEKGQALIEERGVTLPSRKLNWDPPESSFFDVPESMTAPKNALREELATKGWTKEAAKSWNKLYPDAKPPLDVLQEFDRWNTPLDVLRKMSGR